jgi:hypothetical protein
MLNQRNLNEIMPVICIFIFLLWIRSRSLFCWDIRLWSASAPVFFTFFTNKNYQQRNSREKSVLILFIDINLLYCMMRLCGSWANSINVHEKSIFSNKSHFGRKYTLLLLQSSYGALELQNWSVCANEMRFKHVDAVMWK